MRSSRVRTSVLRSRRSTPGDGSRPCGIAGGWAAACGAASAGRLRKRSSSDGPAIRAGRVYTSGRVRRVSSAALLRALCETLAEADQVEDEQDQPHDSNDDPDPRDDKEDDQPERDECQSNADHALLTFRRSRAPNSEVDD